MEDATKKDEKDGSGDAGAFSCPSPVQQYDSVLLAHGGGGRLTHQLIEQVFLQAYGNPLTEERHDGAVFELPAGRFAFTTDSYVIRPLFFPGGDIGELAVNGTVNDLAMCGARPLYLSAGFVIEEGLPMDTLRRVAASMQRAASRAGVRLVTGDTKVVDRGKGDGVYINTAGIGQVVAPRRVAPSSVMPGDAIVLSGDIGRHGIAIMAVREGLEFESVIESDCAPVSEPVLALLEAGVEVHCLRDLTRGGLASTLVEIAEATRLRCEIEEEAIPVREDVRGACEILGFDPLYVANEGRFAAFVPGREAGRALDILRRHPVCESAQIVGRVTGGGKDEVGERGGTGAGRAGAVTLRSRIGAMRVVDMISGEQLPRIC
ncbi:MAG: hydrogenase expression/formation protein HypE [Acidobacteriota bacterium]|nr:hydrogenase expression/formation protein HypE [Acidobacteriota bacterium]